MEAHLVHMSSDGKIAVIAILYEIGLLPDDLLTIVNTQFYFLYYQYNLIDQSISLFFRLLDIVCLSNCS